MTTEAQADALLGRAIERTVVETEDRDEADELRRPVIEILTRHLLARVREEFVSRVLAPERN